jgi:hypothetical protein
MSSIYGLLIGKVRRTLIVSAAHLVIFLSPKFHNAEEVWRTLDTKLA